MTSKRSSGPVQYRTSNPRGGFPRVRGLPDYNSFVQPAGALSPGTPGMPISPKLAPTDTPRVTRRLPASTGRLFLNCSLWGFTHNHASTNMYGLSPYCCSTPNRTIHHQGSTWISLSIHRTQSPQHLYIDSHNTLYFYHVSLSRPQQQLSSLRKLRVTSHTPRLTSPRQRMNVII